MAEHWNLGLLVLRNSYLNQWDQIILYRNCAICTFLDSIFEVYHIIVSDIM